MKSTASNKNACCCGTKEDEEVVCTPCTTEAHVLLAQPVHSVGGGLEGPRGSTVTGLLHCKALVSSAEAACLHRREGSPGAARPSVAADERGSPGRVSNASAIGFGKQHLPATQQQVM